jgi:DNA-binding SARP family transcriptional activator
VALQSRIARAGYDRAMGGGACSLVAIGVLGPLRVEVDGAEVTVSAARERALLARLAIDAGRTVSDAQLIDAVWGDDPPATARPTLQTYVSHLRRVLGPQVIAREGTGYRLDGVELDTDAFTDEVSAGRAASDTTVRLATFRRALGLWRGGALADLNGDTTSAGLRARLEEDRLLVTEDLLETTIATEGPARAVPALEELCTRHPLRERAAALLMTALYRAGRQADALAAYRRLRRALVDELGIEPSQALRDLEQRILEQDAT